MKFLIGLMLGALVTLFVATVFDVPTDSLVAKGKTSWNDFLVATGDALYEFPEVPAAVPRESAATPTVASDHVDDIVAEVAAKADGEAVRDPLAGDLAADKDADTDVHPQPTALPLATRDEPRDLGALLALSEAQAKAEAQAMTPALVARDHAAGDGDLPVQAVWVPFRSQMSARGFAKRLTGQLDHPFSVNREGPGRYQVIFSYADDLERREMLDQVQTVTGEGAP